MTAAAAVVFALVTCAVIAATPSAGERRIWLPVTLVLVATSLIVAVV